MMKESERQRRFLREIAKQGLDVQEYRDKLKEIGISEICRESDKPELENARLLADERSIS